MKRIPRLVIAAPHGRSGKTTVTLGLVAALAARSIAVQPFKKGPDYIDPSWLTRAAGRPCRNLDRYFCTPEQVAAAFVRASAGAEVAVVEGAMGLYDGLDLEGSGSTAEIARVLDAPVVLVVDATRMTRSVAALVRGFRDFDPAIRVAGVILNRVAGPRHRRMLTEAIQRYCGLPVLGAVPKSRAFSIPDRHLGLVPVGEEGRPDQILEAARHMAEEHLDIEAVLALAGEAGPLPDATEAERIPQVDAPGVEAFPQAGAPGAGAPVEPAPAAGAALPAGASKVRIGYMLDDAFTFYYPDNLEALTAAGAELVAVNALSDSALPPVDALYLGGGFPEEFGALLEANRSMREAIRQAVEQGMPVYAECGGLMYLCRTLKYRGAAYEMVGAIPADVVMEEKPQGHGYTLMEVAEENPFFPVGSLIRGHEFHHSRLVNLDRRRVRFAYRVKKGTGIDGEHDGLVYGNILAGYNHLHALAVPGWARSLVERAAAFRQVHRCARSPLESRAAR